MGTLETAGIAGGCVGKTDGGCGVDTWLVGVLEEGCAMTDNPVGAPAGAYCANGG